MEEVRAAVRQRFPISIDYDPVRSLVRGQRIIEPHAVGFTRKGVPIVRGWVRQGVSSSGKIPAYTDGDARDRWRLFRLANIRTIRTLRRQRFPLRPGYRKNDKAMRRTGRVSAS